MISFFKRLLDDLREHGVYYLISKWQEVILDNLDVIKHKAGRWLAQKTFSTSDRLDLYSELSFLLQSNRSQEESLKAMIKGYGNKTPPVIYCLNDMLESLKSGSILPGLSAWIPRQELTILSIGTHDGNMGLAFERAGSVVEGMGEMKSTVLTTLAYPLILVGTSFIMMKVVTVFFFPRLDSLAPREIWPNKLWWLATISEFFVHNAYVIAFILACIVACIFWSLPNLTGGVRKNVLDRLLPWSVYKDVQGVAFLLNVSSLMRAQVKTDDILDKLCMYAPPWLYERLAETKRLVGKGRYLGLALRDSGYNFPSQKAIEKLVLITDKDGSEEVIEKFSQAWLSATIKKIKRTASIIFAFALLFDAAYMILIVLSTEELNSVVGV